MKREKERERERERERRICVKKIHKQKKKGKAFKFYIPVNQHVIK